MIVNIKDEFITFDTSIYTHNKDFSTAEIDLWIDVSSITTGDAKRDEHLKSADFSDALAHIQISFTSNTIAKSDADGNLELWGEFTIRILLTGKGRCILHQPSG